LLDEAVADNIITSDQADRLEALAEEMRDRRHGDGPGRGQRFERVVGTVAETTGLSEKNVRARLTDGGSVADIAGNQIDEVVAAFLADAEQRFADKVEAGELTREQVGRMLAELETELSDMLAHVLQHGPRSDSSDQLDGPNS
jgi:hypothetical protein